MNTPTPLDTDATERERLVAHCHRFIKDDWMKRIAAMLESDASLRAALAASERDAAEVDAKYEWLANYVNHGHCSECAAPTNPGGLGVEHFVTTALAAAGKEGGHG